jgi:hypothetical protein
MKEKLKFTCDIYFLLFHFELYHDIAKETIKKINLILKVFLIYQQQQQQQNMMLNLLLACKSFVVYYYLFLSKYIHAILSK